MAVNLAKGSRLNIVDNRFCVQPLINILLAG